MRHVFILFFFTFFHVQSEPFVWNANLSAPFSFRIQLPQEPIMQYAPFEIDLHIHLPSSYEINIAALVYALSNSVNPFDSPLKIDSFSSQIVVEKDIQMHHIRFYVRPLKAEKVYFSFSKIDLFSKKNDETPFSIQTPLLSLKTLPFVAQNLELAAPLLWLEPQFPIGLTEENRESLPTDKEKETQIHQQLSQHTFPWFNMLFLFIAVGIGYTFYTIKELWKKKQAFPFQKPLQSRKLLLQSFQHLKNIRSRDKKFYSAFATLCIGVLEYRVGKPLRGLTIQELLHTLSCEDLLSSFQRETIFSFLQQVESGKFGPTAFFVPISEALLTSMEQIIEECLST